MAGMGPPPKDPEKRARRNATPALTALPEQGRTGRVPAWPLPVDLVRTTRLKVLRARIKDMQVLADDPDMPAKQRAQLDQDMAGLIETAAIIDEQLKQARKHEGALWRDLWKTPMAVEWERLRWTREVALYVRMQVQAELGDGKAASEARLRGDLLGLTPMSLLRLRWRVQPREQAATAAAPRSGARAKYGHLRAVGDGVTGG